MTNEPLVELCPGLNPREWASGLSPLFLGCSIGPGKKRYKGYFLTKDNFEGCYEEVETVGLDGKGVFLVGLGAIPFF